MVAGSCLQLLPWKMCDQFFPYCQICCVKLLVSYHLCEKSVDGDSGGTRKLLVDATIWGLKFFHAVIQARGWRHQGPIRCGGHGTRGTWRTLVRHGDFAPMHSLRVTFFWFTSGWHGTTASPIFRRAHDRRDGSLVPSDGTSATWRCDGPMAGSVQRWQGQGPWRPWRQEVIIWANPEEMYRFFAHTCMYCIILYIRIHEWYLYTLYTYIYI